MTTTIVTSNGPKWNGQKPDKLEKLLKLLQNKCNELEFLSVSKLENKKYQILGNFVQFSHVFNLETNDKKLLNIVRAKLPSQFQNKPEVYYERYPKGS